MKELFEMYKWPIITGLIGLIVGISFLTLGFFKTILLLILTLAGVWIGLYLQNNQIIERFIDNRKN